MLKTYKNWLIKKGYATVVNNRQSTCYDYLRAIAYIMKHQHNITIEELAKNISTIAPQYQKGGCYEIIGRGMSRSIRASARAFNQFVLESQAA